MGGRLRFRRKGFLPSEAWIDSNRFLTRRQAPSDPIRSNAATTPRTAMLSLKCGINPLMRHKQSWRRQIWLARQFPAEPAEFSIKRK
jgi:hypothetical protein